jgi:hypothetical protein
MIFFFYSGKFDYFYYFKPIKNNRLGINKLMYFHH